MKIVCKTNECTRPGHYVYLTIDNVYDVSIIDNNLYSLINDDGQLSTYNKKWFYSIEESRDIIIDKII